MNMWSVFQCVWQTDWEKKHCLFSLSFDSICLISDQQSNSYSNIDRFFTPVKDVKTAVAKEGDVDVVAQSHLKMETYVCLEDLQIEEQDTF